MEKNESLRILNWHIVFVQYCNLRCSYCSTGYGKFGAKSSYYMKENIWTKLADLMFSYSRDNDLIFLWVEGGETFLRFEEFFEFARLVQGMAKEKGIRLSIKTSSNGILFDKGILDSCAEYGIDINFSIDGAEENHDRFRRDKNGRPTHKTAVENWKYYKQIIRNSSVSCAVQSVFTGNSTLQEILDFWNKQGEKMIDVIIQEPSRFLNNDKESAQEKRRQDYLDDYREKAFELASLYTIPTFLSDFAGPHSLYQIWRDLLLEKTMSTCGAGINTLGVDALGNLYPCETFIGRTYWILGDVFNGLDDKKLREFRACRDNSMETCHTCEIASFCQGGCLAAGQSDEIVVNSKGGCEFMKQVIQISRDSYSLMREQL